jgi:hypothetical protein
MDTNRFTRRSSLARFGGLVAAAAGSRALVAGTADAGNRAVETGAVSCVLTPERTEGPRSMLAVKRSGASWIGSISLGVHK